MPERAQKTPGPDHPITIEPGGGRVVVTVAGRVVADTTRALALLEASYAPVHYIPREDVDMSALTRTQTSTYCPYKGDASYFSIPAGGDRARDAVWSYETPFPSVSAIKDYLAFYPNRIDSIDIQA